MVDTLAYLAAGMIVVWVILGVYFVYLARSQRRIADRLDRLEHRDSSG